MEKQIAGHKTMRRGEAHLPAATDMSANTPTVTSLLHKHAGGRRRQVEEVCLTALFLATLAVWQWDETVGQERTRAFLRRRLARADRAMVRLWGGAPPPAQARAFTN